MNALWTTLEAWAYGLLQIPHERRGDCVSYAGAGSMGSKFFDRLDSTLAFQPGVAHSSATDCLEFGIDSRLSKIV